MHFVQLRLLLIHNDQIKSVILLLSWLMLSYTALQAQSNSIETLTIADGLSQGMIYDIEQTDDGFLWFATKDGLNRYDGYNFKVYTHDPFEPFSIAGNDLSHLFEDSRGNLWISVIGRGCDVLEKASGRFLHLPKAKDIPGTIIVHSIDESPDGTIWIAAEGGLLKINWKDTPVGEILSPDLNTYITLSLASTGTPEGNPLFAYVIANENNSILVGFREDGFYQYDPIKDTLKSLGMEDIARRAKLLDKSKQGRAVISYIKDMSNVLALENGRLLGFPDWKSIPHQPFGIHSDGLGKIYWSVLKGLDTYIYSIPEENLMKFGYIASHTLIAKFNSQSSALELDRSGNLWVGMSGYGLRKIKLTHQPFQHFVVGQSVRRILSADKIYLWLGGIPDTLELNEKNNKRTQVPISIFRPSHLSDTWELNEKTNKVSPASLPMRGIFHYYKAKDGSASIITHDSKFYYYADHTNLTTPPVVVSFAAHEYAIMTEDQEGSIWAGGLDAGVMRFMPETQRHAYLNLSDYFGKGPDVFSLYADHQQNLWVGTTNGMAKIRIPDLVLEPGSDQFKYENPIIYQTDPENPASLRYNFVTSFCTDPNYPDKFIWVSTKGGGISLLEKMTGTFYNFTTRNSGLPNDVVYGILPDDQGNLWMSTNRGLSRMTCLPSFYEHLNTVTSPDVRDNELIFQNFRESDGLQSDEFNTSAFYRFPDGRLMFGGVNGLTAFYPEAIKERQSDAAALITEIKINNIEVDYFQEDSPLSRPVHLTEKIILRYDQNLVTLAFALMDFVTPEENRFRYKLHGVDPDWVNAGNNHTANYAQLRPGDYQFEVQGNIGYGSWSPSAILQIIVLPPWWASWWAYSLYGLCLMATIYFIVYFFKKRILLRQELKLKFEEANRLQDLDTFKSQVYTNLTHEFRTPLTVILGMTEQLENGSWQSAVAEKEKGKVTGALALIKNNGKNLLQLINQLLDLSKLESKSFKLHLKQNDIVPYLRYVTESFQSYANSNNLSLRFFSGVESLIMDFDPEQIKQVVTNLISNALKFTPSGGDIFVKLNETQNNLDIEVSDTGIGISQEDLPHIFDRFYQVDSSTTRATQGTGIGLAHTQELVKVMGGTISVDSEIGKGTRICVQLPITQSALMDTEPLPVTDLIATIPVVNAPMDEEATYREQSVPLPQLLIIEDNPDVVVYLRACLENDYQIMVAYNGKIGIERALELIPDFIISDVMMPEKDGYQVCDVLKHDDRTSHIPIILLTAKADAVSRMAGLRRGADAYLAKPFNEEELLLQIRVLLENRRRIASYFSKTLQVEQVLPPDPILSKTIEVEDAFLTKVKSIIETNYQDEAFSLPQLCLEIGMSRSQLFRKMKAVTNTAPSDLIRTFRLTRAKTLLEKGELTVAEVTYQVGFKDPSYFTKIFLEEFGILPGTIAK